MNLVLIDRSLQNEGQMQYWSDDFSIKLDNLKSMEGTAMEI